METKKCPYCGEDILTVAKKCKHCGEWLDKEPSTTTPPQPEKIECPACAEKIDKGLDICPFCNEHITAVSEPEPATPLQRPDSKTPTSGVASVILTNLRKGFFATHFINPLRHHYTDFKGNTGLKDYWYFVLCVAIAYSTAMALDFLFGLPFIFYSLTCLALLIPSLAFAVRRLHDTGKSGKWIFIVFVPLVGTIWLLCLLCRKGVRDSLPANWLMPDWLIAASAALLIGAGCLTNDSLSTSTKYYPIEEACKNSDGSFFITLATDDENEYLDILNGYIPEGDITIVSSKDGINYKKVLSGSDIIASKEFRNLCKELAITPAGFSITEIYPDETDPHKVFFLLNCDGLDLDDGIIGSVNIKTGKFTVKSFSDMLLEGLEGMFE